MGREALDVDALVSGALFPEAFDTDAFDEVLDDALVAAALDADDLGVGALDVDVFDVGPLDVGTFDTDALDADALGADTFDVDALGAEVLEVGALGFGGLGSCDPDTDAPDVRALGGIVIFGYCQQDALDLRTEDR